MQIGALSPPVRETDTRQSSMVDAFTFSVDMTAIIAWMTFTGTTYSRALGSSWSLSTLSKDQVHAILTLQLSVRTICMSLAVMMATIEMTCTSTTLRQTCGKRSNATACGQRVDIGHLRLCFGIKCIFLEAMMERDSLTTFTISTSRRSRGP